MLLADAGPMAAVCREYRELFEGHTTGDVAPRRAPIEIDPEAIARDLKAGGYFLDASMMGACELPRSAWYADAEPEGEHGHALVVSVEDGPGIEPGNPAAAWVAGADHERNAVRALGIANVLAGYIRNLGWSARAHSQDAGDVDASALAVRSGLAEWENGVLVAPFIGSGFGLAVVTSALPIAPDRPLDPQRGRDKDLRWWLGVGGCVPGMDRARERRRPSHLPRYPMETIKRVDEPTTLIYEDEIPRVSKRAAFFERALRGDLGEKSARERTRFAVKQPFTFAMRGMQASMVPLQEGEAAPERAPGLDDPAANARALKSLAHWFGTDLAGICRVPEYAWFSHKEDGAEIEPYHRYALVLLIDQGFDTMEGASGDDWISGSQSMRGYMRGAEITGQIAELLRRQGVPARAHTNIDSDVLHIPLILMAGLGELSRIGELVLNPFVGPRFKSAVVTFDLPVEVDRPIDFGLQDMCNKCQKCARECPCDAIAWGDKVMFNGYEMWKPDVERCTRYRLTNPKGAACGRCMKTCPYNHEGLLHHRVFLRLAIHVPILRKWIAELDDKVGNGMRNPVKKWWRDLEWHRDGYAIEPPAGTNRRDLDLGKTLDPAKQKIAYYPASAMPVPNDTAPQPVNRKSALTAAADVESPDAARARRARGEPKPAQYEPTPPAEGGAKGPKVAAGKSGLDEAEIGSR